MASSYPYFQVCVAEDWWMHPLNARKTKAPGGIPARVDPKMIVHIAARVAFGMARDDEEWRISPGLVESRSLVRLSACSCGSLPK